MRLQYYLNSADTIPKFKFGFRPNFLFNIYISNIIQYPRTNITLFADDTTIFSCTEAITNNLNDRLNVLSTWCKNGKIIYNASKSVVIIFSLRRHSTPLPLTYDNVLISWKSTVKYLGVTLDMSLTWGSNLSTKSQLGYHPYRCYF